MLQQNMTAVEWLESLHKQGILIKKSFELAKVIEKENISKAWDAGNHQYFCSKITNEDFDNGEEYYEENYKNN